MIIEKLVIDYLISQNIEGIGSHIYAETPVDVPDDYVLVQRAGGSERDYIRQHTVYTEVISRKSKLAAATNHEAVVEAMLMMRDHTDVYRCVLNSDYDATDTARKEYRYQALWQITT